MPFILIGFSYCFCFSFIFGGIDATEEYINGVTRTNYPKIPASGLECVTVLIGLYDKGR